MRASDFVVESLLANGIDTVYGVSGGSVENLQDAMHRARARLRFVLWFQIGDVHPMFAALNPFEQNVNPDIVAPVQFAAALIHEHLNQFRPRRPMPHLLVELVGDDVAQQRLVGIRRVKHPVRIGRMKVRSTRRMQPVSFMKRWVSMISQCHSLLQTGGNSHGVPPAG